MRRSPLLRVCAEAVNRMSVLDVDQLQIHEERCRMAGRLDCYFAALQSFQCWVQLVMIVLERKVKQVKQNVAFIPSPCVVHGVVHRAQNIGRPSDLAQHSRGPLSRRLSTQLPPKSYRQC
jgi:hypothetical protein